VGLPGIGFAYRESGSYRAIFKGNISGPKSFQEVLDRFDGGLESKSKKVFILDAGIATEENIKLIKSRGDDYIVVVRNKPLSETPGAGYVSIRETHQGKVEAIRLRQEDETILYCRSDLKRKKEYSMRTRFTERFEADLKYAKEGLHKKLGTKKYSKVLERVGCLKQKHARVADLYDSSIQEENGEGTDISWRVKDIEKMDARFSGG